MKQYLFEEAEVPLTIVPLVGRALDEIDRDDGTGYPEFTGGINGGRAYHNGYHARAVISDFEDLASALGVVDIEKMVGIAASAAHDKIHNLAPGENEEASADWLEKTATDTIQLPKKYVRMGRVSILGTIPDIRDGVMVSQAASTQEYASKRDELIAKMVACADLGRLYSLAGPYLAHMLLKEINGCSPTDEIDFEKVLEFQKAQIPFLEQYRFPLPEALGILGTNMARVVSYDEALIRLIEQGDVSTWEGLIAHDLSFMQQ